MKNKNDLLNNIKIIINTNNLNNSMNSSRIIIYILLS